MQKHNLPKRKWWRMLLVFFSLIQSHWDIFIWFLFSMYFYFPFFFSLCETVRVLKRRTEFPHQLSKLFAIVLTWPFSVEVFMRLKIFGNEQTIPRGKNHQIKYHNLMWQIKIIINIQVNVGVLLVLCLLSQHNRH